jgi:hypothetical protein
MKRSFRKEIFYTERRVLLAAFLDEELLLIFLGKNSLRKYYLLSEES